MWHVAVVLSLTFWAAAEDKAKDHGSGDDLDTTSSQSKPSDPSVRLRDNLRRLSDPAVIALSRRLTDLARTRTRLDTDQWGKIVDGLENIPAEQKSELKKAFGEVAPQIGQEVFPTFSRLVSDIVKERNLNPEAPNPVATTETPEAQLRRFQDEIRRLEDLAARRRDERDRERRRSRDEQGRNNPSESASDKGSPQESPRGDNSSSGNAKQAKLDEPKHSDPKRKEKDTRSLPNLSVGGANNDQKEPSRLESFPPPGFGDAGLAQKKPKAAEKNSEEKTLDPSEPKTDLPDFPNELNPGMLGERSTPGPIAELPSSSSFGFSDAASNFDGAALGALSAAKSGSSAPMEDTLSQMSYSDNSMASSESSGSIAGAFQGGVSYISGSSPESDASDEGDGSEGYSNPPSSKPKADIMTSGSFFPAPAKREPGIFRFRNEMQKRACRRIQC